MQETERLKQYMKVDVFKEFINQLSSQPISDVSIDNGTIIDKLDLSVCWIHSFFYTS